jgi:hypothetical protein
MTERPIHLDARDIAGRMGSQAGASQQQRREPTPHEAQRFAQAMKADAVAEESAVRRAPPGAPSPEASADRPASAFDLMRRMSLPATPPAVPPDVQQRANASMERLRQDLQNLVGRLMVGDGSSGAGGRMLMMDISDEILPGVTVSVYDDAGAWVAEFRCREEAPFCLLAQRASSMASKLADELGQDAVWRVMAEGLSPGGEWSALVNNEHQGHPSTEVFASCIRGKR